MRVLVTSTPVPSHFTPTIPLAWALRSAGHEVLVVGQPDVTEAALAAGLPAAEIGDRYDALEALTSKLPAGLRPNQAGRAQVTAADPLTLMMPWIMHARYLMKQYLEFARDWRPDLIISDPHEFSALFVGGVLGVPVVHHRWDIEDAGTAPTAIASRMLGARFARHGLTGGQLPEPALVLDPCPPTVRGPEAATGGPRVLPVQYLPYNGTGSVPDWLLARPAGSRVAVTLGGLTAALNGVPLFRSVVRALEGLPGVEGVVTLPAVYHDELAPVGESIRITEPVPLNLFLDTCAAVVHHGGTGTTLTSCALGLPQLVLPQIGNESVWADRLCDAGLALALKDPAEQDDPAAVREAVRTLLDDERYTVGARKVAEEIAALPSPAALVAELEALCGS